MCNRINLTHSCHHNFLIKNRFWIITINTLPYKWLLKKWVEKPQINIVQVRYILWTSVLITLFFYYSSISDVIHLQQCKLFVDQGGVDRLMDFLSEDSPKRHRDLALLIKDNIQAFFKMLRNRYDVSSYKIPPSLLELWNNSE